MHYDQKRDIQQAIYQALAQNPFTDPAHRDSFQSYLENALEDDSLHHYMGWSVEYLVQAATCHSEDTCAPGPLEEPSYLLTREQRDSLQTLVEGAWQLGSWRQYPQVRQSAIAWAVAGADEGYARAIQDYLEASWAHLEKQAVEEGQ
jgi:hypothetical protein